MKNICAVIILFCLSFSLKAQLLSLMDQYNAKLSYGRNRLTLSEIQGSPYLDKEYKIGSVLTNRGVLYKEVPLKYNCYIDVLEFKKGNTAYDLIPKSIVKRAEFGNKIFVYKPVENSKKADSSYFEVLFEGKATLCARYAIKFYEAELPKGYLDPKPVRFDNFSQIFYISIGDSPAKKISTNKSLIEILSDKQDDVKDFISKRRLSVKKVSDLKQIIAYYNAL